MRTFPKLETRMPIYEYKCKNCSVQKDVMQKYSDAPLTVCPECGEQTFAKQLSAPGFQFKSASNSCDTGACSACPMAGMHA